MQKYIKYTRHLIGLETTQVFAWCAGIVVVWRLSLELINQFLVPMISQAGQSTVSIYTNNKLAPPITTTNMNFISGLHRWLVWDAGWYKIIIEKGYVIVHNLRGQETVAFFPLFPSVVRYVSRILHTPPSITGLVINLVFLCFAAFFLYKMSEEMAIKNGSKNSQQIARFSVIVLLLNPASFFFASLYADALLVLCTTAAFYFALRKEFILAAIFAGLASGCKSTGALILPAILIMYAQSNWETIITLSTFFKEHLLKLAMICIISLSGLLAYVIYLWHRFNSPLLFIKIEKYWNENPHLISALSSIWKNYYLNLFQSPFVFSYGKITALYLASIPIIIIIFSVYLLINDRLKYCWLALYCLLVIAVTLSTGELVSLNRFILILTPMTSYAAVYFYGSKNRTLKSIMLVLLWFSATLLVIFSTIFLADYFVG